MLYESRLGSGPRTWWERGRLVTGSLGPRYLNPARSGPGCPWYIIYMACHPSLQHCHVNTIHTQSSTQITSSIHKPTLYPPYYTVTNKHIIYMYWVHFLSISLTWCSATLTKYASWRWIQAIWVLFSIFTCKGMSDTCCVTIYYYYIYNTFICLSTHITVMSDTLLISP